MKTLLIAALVSMAAHANAHDLWLEKESGGFGLYYGHKRSGHEGAEFVDYQPEWVREALCLDGAAAATAFQSHSAYPFRMHGECAVVFVLTSSGYWTKTPYGTENLPRIEVRMPLRSWLSYESVKRIDQWNEALAKPLAKGLEITPLNDPLSLRKGQKLRLRVSFDGKAVEGVVVAYDGKPRGRTSADGGINIRVRHGGFQLIQASFDRPDASNKADEVICSTNLNFELPEE